MASVVIELSGDEAKLWRALSRVQAKGAEVEAGVKKIGQAGKHTSRSMEESFGARASQQLTSYVTGLFGISQALGLASRGFHVLQQDQEKALQSFIGLGPSEGRLAQNAESPEDLQVMLRQADEMARKYGLARDASRELRADARAQRFEPAMELVAQAAVALEGGNVQPFARVAGQMKELFNNQIDSIQALNAVAAAQKRAPITFGELGEVLPIATEGAAAKINPQETIAILTLFTEKFASVTKAADRLRTFASRVGREEDFEGLSVKQAFEKLRDMPKEDRKEILKDSQELHAAYLALEEIYNSIGERVKETSEGVKNAYTELSPLRQQIETSRSRSAPRIALAGAEQFLEAENEKIFGTRKTELAAGRLTGLAELRRAGVRGFRFRWAQAMSAIEQFAELNIRDSGMTPEEMRRSTIGEADPWFNISPGKTLREVEKANAAAAKQLEAASEKLNRVVGNLEAKTAPPSPSPRFAPNAQRELNAVPAE